MTKSEAELEREALKGWYKPLLDGVVQEMLKRKAVVGAAVEATPVWISPNKILIAKVWGMGQKTRFIWTISGDAVITDHIPRSMAVTPQEAARHFSLKWQMDAGRLLQAAENKPMVENSEAHMKDYTARLVQSAESLYDLTCQDDIWREKTG